MPLPAFVIPLLKIVGSAAASAAASKAVQPDQIGQGMQLDATDAASQQGIRDLVNAAKQNQQPPMQFQPLTYDLIRRNQ